MNILMVDDMRSVVNGMEKSIHWKKLGIDGVFKAYNAYEAKVLLNNVHMDILMTDIEMPGESGLDLVQWVREQKMDMECIIISSHANFDYAKRAMSMSSFQYLLFPCPYEEIESVLAQAIERLKNRREESELTKYGELFRKDDWLKSVLFGRCLERTENKEAVQHLCRIAKLDEQTEGYLCRLQLTNTSNLTEQLDDKLLVFVLQNVLSELTESWKEKLFIQQIQREWYVFFVYTAEIDLCDMPAFKYQMNVVEDTIKKILHMEPDLCFEYCKELGDLPEAYEKLKHKGELLEAYHQNHVISQESDNDLVKSIESYIHDHIAQDITRGRIADAMHMNIDYLARIFKKNTGMTLNDYIINEKMEVARNLLITTKLPVGLIAMKVDYSNFSYFSKLYKKTYNKTPAEERG